MLSNLPPLPSPSLLADPRPSFSSGHSSVSNGSSAYHPSNSANPPRHNSLPHSNNHHQPQQGGPQQGQGRQAQSQEPYSASYNYDFNAGPMGELRNGYGNGADGGQDRGGESRGRDYDHLHEADEAEESREGLGIGMGGGNDGRGAHRKGGQSARPEREREAAREEDMGIPVGFDEGVLRALCELDCGMPLVFDRMKQSMASCREASNFLRKRASIEEEYARNLIKLSKSSAESYSVGEGKAGTYVSSYMSLLRTHESVADNRLKFAQQLSEMSDELGVLGKEVEKSRKASKDLGTRLERGLGELEAGVDKARVRFDSVAEELERLLILKSGESLKDPTQAPHYHPPSLSSSQSSTGAPKRTFGKAISKLKGPKSLAQVAKMEEETRSRMGQASDAYRSLVLGAQAGRGEYFNLQLPRLLRSLKESADELDLGTQYHLSRYAYLFESTLLNDALTIAPVNAEEGQGLKGIIESIDAREDFKVFMQQYALAWQMSGQRGPRREGPDEDDFLSPIRTNISPRPSLTPAGNPSSYAGPPKRPTFAVDLADQMHRDGGEVPRVLEKCCEAIELHGLDSMGIYRLSGTTSRVQRLKANLDRDIEGTDLLSEENLSDINDIAAVMKLWFRELPEPLLTWDLYHGFVEAAKIENDRLRHIRLHERVNDLPDPNYATLKYLMGHLDRVRSRESLNQMGCSNLAIVFGPNLLGAPPSGGNGTGTALADMAWQCKCVETILLHFVEIFVDTES